MKKFTVDTNGTLTTNLISYYKLEDTTDFWGTNNGTNSGTTFSAGKVNNAGVFNGTSNFIDLHQTNPDILPWGTNTFSIAFWAKFDASPNANDTIFSATDYVGLNGVLIAYSGGSFNFYKIGIVTLSYAYTRDTLWHFWVFRASSSGMAIYLDGNTTPVASNTNTANIQSSAARAAIGTYPQSNTTQQWYHKGSIDELGVWSKALSNQEIIDLYNGGNGQTMIEVGGGAARRLLFMQM
jgi:hypothetical protein